MDKIASTILVTGGSGTIGQTLISALHKKGVNIISLGRSIPKHVQKECHINLSADQIEKLPVLFKKLKKRGHTFNGIVNCIGMNTRKDIHETNLKDWNEILSTNLTLPFFVIKEALRLLNPQSSIVNIGSVMAFSPTKSPAYAASKGALSSMTVTLSKQLLNHRINTIAPGPVHSPMIKDMETEKRELLIGKTSDSRFGTPDDVVNLVLFLLSDKSSHITGQTMRVDGGFF